MLSRQATDFLGRIERDDQPTDFTRIEEIRAETRAHYAAGAERAIARHRLDRTDVEVAGVSCERIVSRASAASRRRSAPLLYVFGGAFIVGDPYSDLPVIGVLAEQLGVEVIAPRYRLAPEHPAPAASHDCVAVYRELALTRGVCAVAGESAGGNLALRVAQVARDENLPLPDAMALLSPAVDLRTAPELYFPVAGADPTLSLNRTVEVEAAYVAGSDPTDPAISPAFGDMVGLPPTILTTGTRDLLMPMTIRLHRAMLRAGVAADCRVWDGLWHVFEYYDDYPEAAESLAEIAAFIDSHMSDTDGSR